MAELEPCRVCGVVPDIEVRRLASGEARLWFTRHDCSGSYMETEDEAAAGWNAAQASPDLAAIRAALDAERAASDAKGAGGSTCPCQSCHQVRATRDALDALLGGG